MNANNVPMQKPKKVRMPGELKPASTEMLRQAATTPTAARVVISIFLRSTRSATTPANGAKSNIGMNVPKKSTPSQIDELSVTRAISDCSEMCEIQKPRSPMPYAVKSSLNSRWRSARNGWCRSSVTGVSPTAGPGRPASSSESGGIDES